MSTTHDSHGGSTAEISVQADGDRSPHRHGRHRVGIDGVSGFMGMRWDNPETVRLEIRPDLINAGGLLSGVVTYGLVDYCMGSTRSSRRDAQPRRAPRREGRSRWAWHGLRAR
jgi:hypothetical protein